MAGERCPVPCNRGAGDRTEIRQGWPPVQYTQRLRGVGDKARRIARSARAFDDHWLVASGDRHCIDHLTDRSPLPPADIEGRTHSTGCEIAERRNMCRRGFTHICGKAKEGGWYTLVRHTIAKRMRAKLVEIKEALNRMRHVPVPEQGRWLGQVMRGYLAYFAVPTNSRKITSFHHFVVWHWRRALSRRSQKANVSWARMERIAARWLPPARISHPWPQRRFLVKQAYRSDRAVESGAAFRSGLSQGDRARHAAGGARSRDDRGARRSKGERTPRAARLSLGLLQPHAYHPGRQARAAGAAGPGRAASPPSCSSATSAPSGRWWPRLAEMYVQGVSTRKVKAITEELCGHAFSASAISAINKTAGREPRRLCRAPASRALPLPHPRRPLREGARGRRGDEPGGADRGRHRLGRPAPDPRRRDGQPREPLGLEGLPLAA